MSVKKLIGALALSAALMPPSIEMGGVLKRKRNDFPNGNKKFKKKKVIRKIQKKSRRINRQKQK